MSSSSSSSGEYLVVARRYRPQTFDELIGQEHVARALKQAIASSRVGHAYLFTGARGVGKTSAARILAKALNCVHGPTPTPCNQCEVCHSVTAGDDVDVIEIDGASNRQIDDIRQLRQNVGVRPSRVRFKVYIIDEVHMLTKEAFNALLKTLEEPPEHVKFIFATTDPQKVPITILSRCQRFDFAGIESESIEARLAQIAASEGVEIDEEALSILAARAAGSMRDSQSLLEQLLAAAEGRITTADVNTLLGIAPAQQLADLVTAIVERNAALALNQLDVALADGADAGQLVDQLIGFFRDIMAARVGCDERQYRFALRTQAAIVKSLAAQLGLETVLAMLGILDETAARLRVSVHARTLTEMALVRLCQLHDLDQLAALVSDVREREAASPQQPAAPRAVTTPPVRSAPPISKAETQPAEAGSAASAPAAPAARPSVALSSEKLPSMWRQVLAGLDELAHDNAAMASEVRLGHDGAIELLFPPAAQLSKDLCEQPVNRQQIEAAWAQLVGDRVALRMVTDTAAATAQPVAAAPRVSRRELHQDVAERYFVKRALELFEGDLARLKIIPPRPAT